MRPFVTACLFLCLPILAQSPSPTTPTAPLNLFAVYQEASLSSSAAVLTVQQPASGAKNVVFAGAVIYCSVNCVPSLEMNGTAATATAATPIKLNTAASAPLALAYTGSNVGVGTVVFKYNIAAGGPVSIQPGGMALARTSGQNMTIRTDSITGTARILLMWSEQ